MPGIFSSEFWTGQGPYTSGRTGQQQQGLAEMLMKRAKGETTSAAELAMQAGFGQAQRGAAAQAAGLRGVNPGMAARMAFSTQAGLGGESIRQGAILRAQEQATAEQMLSQHLSGMETQRMQGYGLQGGQGFFGNLLGAGMQAAGAYFGAGGGRGSRGSMADEAPRGWGYRGQR